MASYILIISLVIIFFIIYKIFKGRISTNFSTTINDDKYEEKTKEISKKLGTKANEKPFNKNVESNAEHSISLDNKNKFDTKGHIDLQEVKLPELTADNGFRMKWSTPKKISFENAEEIEKKFEDNKNLIKTIRIQRDYVYVEKRRDIGISNIIIKKGDKLIHLEDEAINFFKEQGLESFRTILESNNKLINIFYFINAVKEKATEKLLPKVVIQSIKKLVSKNDIAQFAKYSIGIPDLIVIDTNNKEKFFCEVKSENDKLSISQKAWFVKNFVDYKSDFNYYLLMISPNEKNLIEHTRINGLRHYRTPDYLDTIQNGSNLILELDKKNKYDKHAIKIINSRDSHFLGFVPANFNERRKIWKKIEEGNLIECHVSNIFRNNSSWLNSHSIYIDIKFKR